MAKDHPESQQIDPYLMLVIQTTSEQTARAAMREHQEFCAIGSIKREFYGDGTDILPGVKADVKTLKTDVGKLKECKKNVVGFIFDRMIGPVVTAVIVAAIMAWVFNR